MQVLLGKIQDLLGKVQALLGKIQALLGKMQGLLGKMLDLLGKMQGNFRGSINRIKAFFHSIIIIVLCVQSQKQSVQSLLC